MFVCQTESNGVVSELQCVTNNKKKHFQNSIDISFIHVNIYYCNLNSTKKKLSYD